jgi:hypothetical protein
MKKNYMLIFAIILFTLGIYIGLTLGGKLDRSFDLYPIFTWIGLILGIGIPGYVNSILLSKDKRQSSLSKDKRQSNPNKPTYPIIEVSKEQVRDAIRKYSEALPKGVYRSILVMDDYSIDFEKLTSILKGLPSKPFYMSKETYDIFDESEKEIPAVMDLVQKAVDAYARDHREYPMLPYDPLRRVNYYLLLNERYLNTQPEIEFFITDYDGIITHKSPKKDRGL